MFMSKNIDEIRADFLFNMYNQLFNDINRHILVIWQSISVLVGAFAIFALAEKKVISIDIATGLIILLSGWLLAHLYDSSFWYNRNLVIIANIEKEFLVKDDLRNIHYYFGRHRQQNKMIMHLKIQFCLGIGISSIVIIYHFFNRIIPGLFTPWRNIEPERAIPYIFLTLVIILLVILKNNRDTRYKEFLENSPGKDIDTSGVKYESGSRKN
jgi:hypothetical protein